MVSKTDQRNIFRSLWKLSKEHVRSQIVQWRVPDHWTSHRAGPMAKHWTTVTQYEQLMAADAANGQWQRSGCTTESECFSHKHVKKKQIWKQYDTTAWWITVWNPTATVDDCKYLPSTVGHICCTVAMAIKMTTNCSILQPAMMMTRMMDSTVNTNSQHTKYVIMQWLITFRVSHRRQEMYCGHPRLCVCL